MDDDFDSARDAAADVDFGDDAGSSAEDIDLDGAAGAADGELGAADEVQDGDFDGSADGSIDAGRVAEYLAAGGELDDELSEELGIDNIVGPLEAGLGGGLDQAEEARAGITDEDIARRVRQE